MVFLGRIWAGIVGAMAGAAVGMVVHLVGMVTIGLPLDYLQWIVLACVALGFVCAFVVGNKSFGSPKK
jgi:hypothetical protein